MIPKRKVNTIWYHLYVESKIWPNEPICETETESHSEYICSCHGDERGRGWIGSLGLEDAKWCIQNDKRKVLLHSTENCIQNPVIKYHEKEYIFYIFFLYRIYGLPRGHSGKEYACNAGNPGLIPRLERYPGRGSGSPFQYSCLEKFHGQRSLVDYSPWGWTESDMTEHACKNRIYIYNISELLLYNSN